jgi:uncharacterized protein (DUF488 family)
MPQFVYTIGHSNHSQEAFIGLLAAYHVNAIADVRSHPYSRFNPQFNKENLQDLLRQAGLAYVFLGRELGARPKDPSCYVDGRVQYERLARTILFQEGLARIIQGAHAYRIALMCAEKDPLTCHRAILVCRELQSSGIGAQHILEDGRIENHPEATARLLAELGFTDHDLFRNREEMISDAYDLRGKEIAYVQERSTEESLGGIQG